MSAKSSIMRYAALAVLAAVAHAWRANPGLLQTGLLSQSDAELRLGPPPGGPSRPPFGTSTTSTSSTTTVTVAPFFPYQVMPCPTGAVLTTPTMTYGLYDKIAGSVQALAAGLSSDCSDTTCPQGEWAGCVLRMSGHDFMDYKNGSGGSDGCIDLSVADNGGLAACLYQGEYGVSLYNAYVNFCSQVSLADFLVIAGEAVMNYTRGIALADKPTAPPVDFRSRFKYGRTTATSCTFATGRLPDAEQGCTAVENVFLTRMNLTWAEAAALMGTHTLGRARIENSGYDGWWTNPAGTRKFDHDYYGFLFSKGWKPESVNGNPAKNQWTRSDVGASQNPGGKQMMLNTDMCLGYQNATNAATQSCCAWIGPTVVQNAVALDGNYCGNTSLTKGPPGIQQFAELRKICCVGVKGGPGSDCESVNKPNGKAIDAIKLFISSEASWLASFYVAWTKATTNGFSGLQSPGA